MPCRGKKMTKGYVVRVFTTSFLVLHVDIYDVCRYVHVFGTAVIIVFQI